MRVARHVASTAAALLLLAGAWSSPAPAQELLGPDEVRLQDSIAVEIVGREVVAFDLLGSGRLTTRLEIDEVVLWTGARGRVSVVLTDRRLLGATPSRPRGRSVATCSPSSRSTTRCSRSGSVWS